jgi:hypothetical protein
MVGVVKTDAAAACSRMPPAKKRAVCRRERVAPRFHVAQRLVQVPAVGEEVRQCGPAHERRVQPVAAAHLFDGAAEQQHHVRRREAELRVERELHLSGPPLVLHAAQRDVDRHEIAREVLEDVVDLVVAVLGEVLEAVGDRADLRRVRRIARLLRREHRVLHLRDVELDLEARDVLVARLAEPVELRAQDLPRRERDRRPVREEHVGEDPARRVDPRQDAEGGRVGHEDHVRIPAHLGDPEAAALDEQRHEDVVRRVHDERRALEVVAVAQSPQEVRDGHRLAAQDSVLVAPGDAHLAQAVVDDLAGEPLGRLALLIRPQPVLVDEAELADPDLADRGNRRRR